METRRYDLIPFWSINISSVLFSALIAINAWFWVIAILGFGKKYLNFNN